MSQQAADYTPLESLFLFQSIASNGVDAGAFARVSEILRTNPLIKADAKYDARRLGPEPLRQLFLVLVRDELKTEADRTEGGAAEGTGNASPNARKRKLGSPPLPTLKDVYDNIEKIPVLVDRLYARYREHVIKQIREDEVKFDKVQGEIALIERSDRERLVRAAASAANGSPALAPKDGKQPIARNISSPVGGGPPLSQLLKKPPYANPPPPASRPPLATQTPIQPAGAVPSHLAPGTPPVRPSPSPKPQNSAASVLQAPTGVPQAGPRKLQAPAPGQPTRQSISPRPDIANSGRATPPKPQGAPPSGLKWEKPYVPSQGVQPPAGLQTGTPNAAYQPSLPQHQQQRVLQNTGNASPAQGQGTQAHPPTPKAIFTQPSGQLQPPVQAAAPKPGSTGPQPQVRSSPPVPAPPRAVQPAPVDQAQPVQQIPRPIAAASTTPSPGPGAQSLAGPPQRWPQAPSQTQRPVASPAQVSLAKDKSVGTTPHGLHSVPRPAIPEHMIRQAASTPPRKISIPPSAPHTPVSTTPGLLMRGFGTRWQSTSTPSTPAPLNMEPESPAFEPVSPPTQPINPPRPRGSHRVSSLQAPPKPETTAAKATRSSRTSRGAPRRGISATPSVSETRRSQSVLSHAEETHIKDEGTTPQAADKDAPMGSATPSRVAGRAPKRKRQDTPPVAPPILAPETHVLWTRGFTKVSSSALDQISSHRDANMFAHVIRERDAPGYRSIVLKPQDITSIRQAIKHGNKAAVQAASSLPDGDPGSAAVWLPISEDLTPPKGIVNSAQLERELVHMFCNAIMYNADPDRGPGPSFIRRPEDEEDDTFGYRLDEHGVVKNTQAMFVEVEKLLGDLRSAEKERSVPPPTGGNTRRGSAATPAGEETDPDDKDKDKEHSDEGPAGGATKRRRVATRG